MTFELGLQGLVSYPRTADEGTQCEKARRHESFLETQHLWNFKLRKAAARQQQG